MTFSIEPGMLFLIQFFWQFPHFWAIGWLQFDEYKKAGFNLMPMGQKNKKAVVQIIIYTVWLIISFCNSCFKINRKFLYLPNYSCNFSSLLGSTMLYYAVKLYKHQTNKEARQLMLSSVLYITLIQIIYVVDKFLH